MADNPDRARVLAFRVLREVTAYGAYANLALSARLRGVDAQDAAFATELVNGTARAMGTLDAIIEAAAGRATSTLQPAVVDVLRLGAYQALRMRVPPHAAVATSVDLAASQIGHRATGVVNAIMRRITARSWGEWLDTITAGLDTLDAIALRTGHPRWIVQAYADRLEDVVPALEANNVPPQTTLAVRPGLMDRGELVAVSGGEPTPHSPWGVTITGDPGSLECVRDGRAGVQDEGSQLVVYAACSAVEKFGNAGSQTWLDLCAGPGGKTALLRGLAGSSFLVAAEVHPHRAELVAQALRAYRPSGHQVVAADGTTPAWCDESFDLVMADVPCSGLGALRRRPEARWRRSGVEEFRPTQLALLEAAWAAVRPGGIVAYITCSPHWAETEDLVLPFAEAHGISRTGILDAPALLPDVPDCAGADRRFVQLWPHRHGTDAMFLALLRKPAS